MLLASPAPRMAFAPGAMDVGTLKLPGATDRPASLEKAEKAPPPPPPVAGRPDRPRLPALLEKAFDTPMAALLEAATLGPWASSKAPDRKRADPGVKD